MTMATDLLAATEALTGPSFEIDALVGRLFGLPTQPWTASLDEAVALVRHAFPGWSWRVASCHVSDDAWIQPDFEDPTWGPSLRSDWPEECKRDPLGYLDTDVDRRPPGQPAIALVEAILRAVIAQDAEAKPA